MKEIGIIMSGDHPKKILDGLKTMTRRTWGLEEVNKDPDNWFPGVLRVDGAWSFLSKDLKTEQVIKCPYGQVGDLLWVKETLRRKRNDPNMQADYITYVSDFSPVLKSNPNQYGPILIRPTWQWKKDTLSSLFMPRWASRIDRTITGLRAERLQEITEEDAIAEGVSYNTTNEYAQMRVLSRGQANEDTWPTPQESFRKLWDSLNAKRGYGWEVNPWVWPISFKEVQDK